jgi:hypothetical protein
LEDNRNNTPFLGKELAGTGKEMPVQNNRITPLRTENQKTGDDEPIPDKDAGVDKKTEDDESVFDDDTCEDQKTDGDEPSLNKYAG